MSLCILNKMNVCCEIDEIITTIKNSDFLAYTIIYVIFVYSSGYTFLISISKSMNLCSSPYNCLTFSIQLGRLTTFKK